MATEREPWDDTLLDESDEDFDKRASSDDDETDDDAVEEDSGGDGEPRSSDPRVNAVIDYIGQQETAKERKAAEKAEFLALVEQNMPGYQAPVVEELSPIERVAQKVAAMDTNEFSAFKAQLQQANEDLYASYHGGADAEDEGPLEAPFDPNTLDSKGFDMFIRAAAAGGANARETPTGFSREEWSKAVASSLGKG